MPSSHREAVARGIVEQSSGATVGAGWQKTRSSPWNYRSWIFPRDPDFRAKAARALDLYAGRFEGKLLRPGEFVLCADEKPSIQARARLHPPGAPLPGGDGQLIEHEYERMGALCYLAAWDVRRAKLFDRCEPKGGIEPFDRLVAQVMTQDPYASAERVFWIVDNGSSHRGQRSIDRLEGDYDNLVLVHLPVHASWLNQIEIYFSIVQRKVLSPTTSPTSPPSTAPSGFEHHWNEIAAALRLELHPQRPRRADRSAHHTRTSAPTRRMITSELTTGST